MWRALTLPRYGCWMPAHVCGRLPSLNRCLVCDTRRPPDDGHPQQRRPVPEAAVRGVLLRRVAASVPHGAPQLWCYCVHVPCASPAWCVACGVRQIEEKLKRNALAHRSNGVVLKQIAALPADTATYLTIGTRAHCGAC